MTGNVKAIPARAINNRMRVAIQRVTVTFLVGLISLTQSVITSSFSYAHGTFHERLNRVNQQIEQDPKNARLYVTRAGLYRDHGDWHAALQDLDRASQVDPKRKNVDYFRGRVFLAAGDPNRAEIALRRFLDGAPNHSAARVARARALVQLNRYWEAAEDYTHAIKFASVLIPGYYLERAQALSAAGEEYRDDAIRGLDEGIARLGPLTTLYLAAIDLEMQQGRVEQALVRLDHVSGRAPPQPWWFIRRGEILEQSGRMQEARSTFQQALIAIQRLSPHRRSKPAVTRMQSKVQDALQRLVPLVEESGGPRGSR